MADYFISDLHISDNTPEILSALAAFIQSKSADIDTLYILGDLFDFWVGDDYTTDHAQECASLLRQLPKIHFMAGNRDFLLGDNYATQANMSIIEEPVFLSIANYPAIVMHGDTLCTEDIEYQQVRATIRNAEWQEQFLQLPLAKRFAEAIAARQNSKKHIQSVDNYITDVSPQTVNDCITANKVSILLHGHTHKPAIHSLANQQWRIVLGDWSHKDGYFLRVDRHSCELIHFCTHDGRITNEQTLASISN